MSIPAWLVIGNSTFTSVTVASTIGQGKMLALGNSGTPPPAGWETPAFDDSAWIPPIAGHAGGTVVPGSDWISDFTGARGGQPYVTLFRIPFTLPAGAIVSASLTIEADDEVTALYLEGDLVYAHTGGTLIPAVTVSLATTSLVTGTNVLAVEIKDTTPFYLATSFVLTVTVATADLTDQTAYLYNGPDQQNSWRTELRQRGTASVHLYIPAGDSFAPVRGSQVYLYEQTQAAGFARVFAGLIQDIENQYTLGNKGDHFAILTVVSFESVYDTVYVTAPKQYVNQTCGFIFADLNTTYGSPLVAVGTIDAGETLALFTVTIGDKISDLYTQLATTSLKTWYVDPVAVALNYVDPASTAAPITLSSSDFLWDSANWKVDGADYRNRQAVKLSFDAFEHSKEFFTGSGQTSFTLKRPVEQVTNAYVTLSTPNTATGTFTGVPALGGTITIGPASGAWQAAHVYALAGVIIVNGYVQKVTSAGTSGGSQPVFSTVTGQTTADNTVIWTCQGPAGLANGTETYTWVDTIDNTVFGDVLRGATAAACAQNLVDAINSNAGTRGVSFSLPTWEGSQCNAVYTSGASFTLQQKSAGTGWVAQISETSTNFSWSGSVTSGGTSPQGSVGPNEPATISLQVYASGTNTAAPALIYTKGSATVTLATPLNSGTNLNVEYTRMGGDVIECERTDLVDALAIVTRGTGKVQQLTDQSSTGLIATSRAAGLQFAQQTLAAYDVPPDTFKFDTYVAGLATGQTLPAVITKPIDAGTFLDGNWVIESIDAQQIPGVNYKGSHPWLSGGLGYGHFRYSITAINLNQIGSWLDFWNQGGGSAGGGGGLSATSGGGMSDAASQTGVSSPLTTKGDLFGFDTVSDRVPIGTDGQVLTADSTQALGLKWAAVAATGTVTHTGNLTADLPVFGNGVADIKVGTKTGNTTQAVTATGAATSGRPLIYDANGNAVAASVLGNTTTVQLATGAGTSGYPLLYDASGNAIARQPRGNTTVVQLADATTAATSGDLASFDASSNIKDSAATVAKLSQNLLTTKGDLLSWSTLPARLAVGSNTQVLTADSTQTLGVKWAAAAAGVGGVSVKTADYTAVSGDNGTLLVMNSAGAHTITLPAAPPSSTWFIAIQDIGAGTLTVSRNGLTIDGAASNLTITQNSGVLIFTDGTNYFTERGMSSGAGAGTVTSVALTLPAELTVTGSPVTTSGTLAATWANETANQVFAGPASGAAATPAFRALVAADIPAGAGASAVVGTATAVALTTTIYIPLGGGGLSSTTEANVDVPAPGNSTLSNFYVELSAAPGVGNSVAITVRKNSADTAITVTISGAAVAGSDTTHSFTCVAGDLLDIKIVPTGTIVATPNFLTSIAWAVTAAAGAMVQISKQTVSGTSASITFNAISGAYSDLLIVWQARDNSVATAQSLFLQFNADTGANYDFEFNEDVGTTATAPSQNFGQVRILCGTSVSSSSGAGLFGAGRIEIPIYADTNANKTVIHQHGWKSGTSSGSIHAVRGAGWWRNSAAITSILLFPGSGSFVTGSTFVLYGIT